MLLISPISSTEAVEDRTGRSASHDGVPHLVKLIRANTDMINIFLQCEDMLVTSSNGNHTGLTALEPGPKTCKPHGPRKLAKKCPRVCVVPVDVLHGCFLTGTPRTHIARRINSRGRKQV
jgi:hypothetical protein